MIVNVELSRYIIIGNIYSQFIVDHIKGKSCPKNIYDVYALRKEREEEMKKGNKGSLMVPWGRTAQVSIGIVARWL